MSFLDLLNKDNIDRIARFGKEILRELQSINMAIRDRNEIEERKIKQLTKKTTGKR